MSPLPSLPPLLSGQSMNCPLTLVWSHCHTVESPMSLSSSALLRSAPSAPLLRASASTLPGNVGTRHHSSKRQRTADAWKKKKKPMPLRVEHTRSMGQEKTNCWPFGKVTSFFLPPKLPPALNQRPVFCVFPQLCLVAQPGGQQRSFHPASSFLRTKQIQEK